MWARLSTHIGCACAQEAEKDGGGANFPRLYGRMRAKSFPLTHGP